MSPLHVRAISAAAALAFAGVASAQTAPAAAGSQSSAVAPAPAPAPAAAASGAVVRGDSNASITTNVRRNVPRAQRTQPVQSQFRPANPTAGGADQPDVLLDIPNLSVDEITLEVQNLQAHVSLDARVANLVKITAGVDANIDRVNLTIKGVQATALLIVRLENVREIVNNTLDTINKNPQILERLLQSVDNTVGTVGNVANTALQPGGVLSQTVNTLGQTVSRTLDTTGNIVERTVDQTGRVLGSNTIGRALDLPVVRETSNTAGQVVRQVRDASGAVLELTLDNAGKLVSSRVVSSANQPRPGSLSTPSAALSTSPPSR